VAGPLDKPLTYTESGTWVGWSTVGTRSHLTAAHKWTIFVASELNPHGRSAVHQSSAMLQCHDVNAREHGHIFLAVVNSSRQTCTWLEPSEPDS